MKNGFVCVYYMYTYTYIYKKNKLNHNDIFGCEIIFIYINQPFIFIYFFFVHMFELKS